MQPCNAHFTKRETSEPICIIGIAIALDILLSYFHNQLRLHEYSFFMLS